MTTYDDAEFRAERDEIERRRDKIGRRVIVTVMAILGAVGAVLGWTMVKHPEAFEQFGAWWATELWPAAEPYVAAGAFAILLPMCAALIGGIVMMFWLDY